MVKQKIVIILNQMVVVIVGIVIKLYMEMLMDLPLMYVRKMDGFLLVHRQLLIVKK